MKGARTLRVGAGGSLRGRIRVPGDKSISHRAVMLGSIAEGVSDVDGFLDGADCQATAAAYRALGIQIEFRGAQSLRIHGRGLTGLRAPSTALDLGNSGTAMRLMAGVLAGQGFASTLVGDASLSQRPMGRIIRPLRAMGAQIEGSGKDQPPLMISPAALSGIDWTMDVASAQVKSAILLAGLYAQGPTTVRGSGVSRDHTERMLRAMGANLSAHPDGDAWTLQPGMRLAARAVSVPGDPSSAAFFLVGASIAPGSDVTIEGVGLNPTRIGLLEILRAMGANIETLDLRMLGDEPVADLRVRSAELCGIEVPEHLVATAIDEFPALFVAAACAQGVTRIRGAAELRVKESDRIAVMAQGLRELGIEVHEVPDGADIQGGAMRGGVSLQTAGDHRCAMAWAMAALACQEGLQVLDSDWIETSFPRFTASAAALGLTIEEHAQ